MSYSYQKIATIFLASIVCVASFPKEIKAATDPATVGQWSGVFQWPVKAVHASLLPNGKVLTWPSGGALDKQFIWDPIANNVTPIALSGLNPFCSGHSVMADGKIFVAGGHNVTNGFGLATAIVFDPVTENWTRLPDMRAGRWYPDVVQLANGNMLVTGGTVTPSVRNVIPEVWDIGTNSWRQLTTAAFNVTWYPKMFQAMNGKVFMAGMYSSSQAGYLDTNGTGVWEPVASKSNLSAGVKSAAMLDENRIMVVGGIGGKNAEIIDLTGSTPTWTPTGSLNFGRSLLNSVLLPDGSVLALGGSSVVSDNVSTAVLTPEIWNPGTGQWTIMANNQVYRGYHSTALLLPDGRVMLAGGQLSGTSAEVFSPPYLFNGSRPTITSVPSIIASGSQVSCYAE